jgi:hypothetical protein
VCPEYRVLTVTGEAGFVYSASATKRNASYLYGSGSETVSSRCWMRIYIFKMQMKTEL